MAKGLNKVLLIGRLGKDPELKYTQGGTAVAKFSLATDESWKDQSGEKKTRTEWHNVIAWGKLAEICGKYLAKGRLVYVEGKIQSREWEAEDGTKRRVFEIVASDMNILDSNGEKRETERANGAASDDDVPF